MLRAACDNNALTVTDVTISYPEHGFAPPHAALEAVNLTLNKGEILGVVGETGSGKSTLAAVLSGRAFTHRKALGNMRMSSGNISVLGKPLARLRGKNRALLLRRVGFLPQDAGEYLQHSLTAGELLAEPLMRRTRRITKEIGIRVASMLDSVQLPLGVAEKFPYELSNGQRQRVALARALITTPEILVADEPSAGIDVNARTAVVDLIAELQRERDFSAVIASSDLDVLRTISSRIIVLHHGYLVASGPVDDVLAYAEHPYVARLNAVVSASALTRRYPKVA